MKLTEGLGIVNNLIFFRSFFKKLEFKYYNELLGFYFLVTFRVDWKEAPEWMLMPQSQDRYYYCHFSSAEKGSLLSLRAEHVAGRVTQSSLQEFKAS